MDAAVADADKAVAFWSAALGAPAEPDADRVYHRLDGAAPGIEIEVQAVDDVPRYHIDIETDDVAAETARLEALGATRVAEHNGWKVLRAPSGHLLCVVPVQSDQAFFTANSKIAE